MSSIIITTELVSVAFLLCILVGMILQHEKGDLAKYFIMLCALTAFFTFIDALSYLIDGKITNVAILSIVNALTYIGGDCALIVFVHYVDAILIKDKKETSNKLKIFLTCFLSLDMLMIFIGTLTGKLFTINNGVFEYGPWSTFSGIAVLIGFFIIILYINVINKSIGKKERILVNVYLIVPFITAIIEMIWQELSFSYFGMSIATTIIYVFLQSGLYQKEQIEKETIIKMMHTDTLTGINNRSALDDLMDSLPPETNIYLIFCDVNNLKYTNDVYGHVAGDNLLKAFVEILRQFFNDEHIFRISGDEFVVIYYGNDIILPSTFASFNKEIRNNSWIASCGYATGLKSELRNIYAQAEKQLYKDKAEYHKTTGRDRTTK